MRTTPPSSTGRRSCSARSRSATSKQRLDPDRFIRVHRSHIVNIAHVIGHRRAGDNELIEMDADHYTVPVSRSRIGALKSRVAALNGSRRRHHHIAAQ